MISSSKRDMIFRNARVYCGSFVGTWIYWTFFKKNDNTRLDLFLRFLVVTLLYSVRTFVTNKNIESWNPWKNHFLKILKKNFIVCIICFITFHFSMFHTFKTTLKTNFHGTFLVQVYTLIVTSQCSTYLKTNVMELFSGSRVTLCYIYIWLNCRRLRSPFSQL